MKEALKTIDSKTITSAGGIILAMFLAYALWNVSANDIAHLEASVVSHQASTLSIQQETNTILRELTRVLESIK